MRIAGLRFADLDGFLNKRIGEQYRKLQLSVSLGQLRSIDVLVVGRARLRRVYGELTGHAGECGIRVRRPRAGRLHARYELRRNGKTVTALDLTRILAEGDESEDAPLLGGDTIYFPPASPREALAGSVNEHGNLRGPRRRQGGDSD